VTDTETRVLLIKPGEVLLIGHLGHLAGFAGDIDLDKVQRFFTGGDAS
jgi:hypothetical protein